MTASRDTASRLRQLNPLRTTALGVQHGQLGTPHSAVSVASYNTFGRVATPSSSMPVQQYNPQEWAPTSAVGERPHPFPQPATYREAQASGAAAPPPYSPPRSQGPANTGHDTPPANGPVARTTPSTAHRPSPEPSANQSFPPPPGTNNRGASRERRFGLPSLSRWRDRDQAESSTPVECHTPSPHIYRPQPLSVNTTRAVEANPVETPGLPPNSRRAVSTSAIETPTSARTRSSSQIRWDNGTPLPPPPPGPPPSSQSRSQSLNRTTTPIVSPPTRRPPPDGVTALGPVPPTPAEWAEQDQGSGSSSASGAALSIDTSTSAGSGSQSSRESMIGQSPGSAGLNRTGAVRGEKTLRERRNESRTRHQRTDSSSSVQPLSNIVVPDGPNVARRVSIHRVTPLSSGRMSSRTPRTGEDERHTTPRPSAGLPPETPTPPFSPLAKKSQPVAEPIQQHIAPKALPTPPPQSRSASSSSRLQHDMYSSISSLPSAPMSSQPMTKQMVVTQTADQFCRGSIERFQAFAEREAAAKTDADRVKLFASFVVNESRLRRERYTSAIGAMGSEIFDLTRDLFRPMRVRRDSSTSQSSEWTPQVSEFIRESPSPALFDQVQSNSAPPSANRVSKSPAGGSPANANWSSNQFMPSLSPILSMSVSEALDGASSRGRPASRWWEVDSTGESNLLERSKRESKYMGVPKEAREALQWEDAPGSADAFAGPSRQATADEYPPEKTGWHETDQRSTPRLFRNSLLSMASSAPNTPSASLLDISRLVTLPPPYPRHHPAVNNNHPELASIRTLVRAISDMTEVQATKEQFIQESNNARAGAAEAAASRRKSLRMNLQQEISSGNMSYAEAAAIEADTEETEKAQLKDLGRKDFERFQNAVIAPLNDLLTGRIAQATTLFDDLRAQLFVETQAPNPNMAQEEGDERPELLEKLTLLKWVFEARETLHRAIFDLLSDRNGRYRDVVCTPYRLQSGQQGLEKLRTAEAFFADDERKRRAAFAAEVAARTDEFRGVVEDNVARGVDMQLNAFWDIAPPLARLLDGIPARLLDRDRDDPSSSSSFGVQIPAAEYDENPDYARHPLQYLYSLLLHAEKSTYQFIESQTNLQCLLHQVKESAAGARAKAEAAEQQTTTKESGGDGDGDVEAGAGTEDERLAAATARLTEDLKEKVRVVQDQWDTGLGDGIRGVKERVGEFLLSTGGWDESLEDGGVGGS
ncbi:hypothetical protein GGR56DRAFT_416644 [Xylariaceae sp. FL0804]|nr:hypothetical protein GGR56DRAFT_416644 [Xylariaceae sp. FL0804]